jgi:hypothetical protein
MDACSTMALNDDANVNADAAGAADTTSEDNNGQDDLLPAPSFGGYTPILPVQCGQYHLTCCLL